MKKHQESLQKKIGRLHRVVFRKHRGDGQKLQDFEKVVPGVTDRALTAKNKSDVNHVNSEIAELATTFEVTREMGLAA